MANNAGVAAARVEPGVSLLDKVSPHAPKVVVGAAVLGLIAVFLPAATVSLLGQSESVSVLADWRGRLGLLGYLVVGVMTGQALKKGAAMPRAQVRACLIIAGGVAGLAVWLLLVVGTSGFGAAVTTGLGCYVNALAGLALAAGAALQARRAGVI